MFQPEEIKKDFPIFQNHPALVYLDSGARSLTPQSVISKLTEYYEQYPVNIARGIYALSEKATAEYEETRDIVADFIHAHSRDEIIFVRNTTEALNLIAYSHAYNTFSKGDNIVVSAMEHHSNFVPWQMLAKRHGVAFTILDITHDGAIDEKKLSTVITSKTKIFSFPYVSNVLGTINSAQKIIKAVRKINPNVIIILDGAQAVPHIPVDVQKLDCDFLAFSSHKMLGPTGVGVLWGRKRLLDSMEPFNFGGEMVESVSSHHSTFKPTPHKFEAGTPDIAGVIAFKEAIRYLKALGMENVREHSLSLTKYTQEKLQELFNTDITILGTKESEKRGGIISFIYKPFHPHDIAAILDQEKNVCVRAGKHCAMPLHDKFGITASTRVSFYIYTTQNDIDMFIEGLKKVHNILKK